MTTINQPTEPGYYWAIYKHECTSELEPVKVEISIYSSRQGKFDVLMFGCGHAYRVDDFIWVSRIQNDPIKSGPITLREFM